MKVDVLFNYSTHGTASCKLPITEKLWADKCNTQNDGYCCVLHEVMLQGKSIQHEISDFSNLLSLKRMQSAI